jgi:hypothetical protein
MEQNRTKAPPKLIPNTTKIKRSSPKIKVSLRSSEALLNYRKTPFSLDKPPPFLTYCPLSLNELQQYFRVPQQNN